MSEPEASPSGRRGGAEKASTWTRVVLPAVVERELRVALHRRDVRKARSRVARLGVIGVAIFMLFGALTGTASWLRPAFTFIKAI